jgi:5'-3' exonuclease
MGVPGIFKWFLKKFRKEILMKKIDFPIEHLYIDANCLFHPECQKIKEKYLDKNIDNDDLENEMFEQITKYLDYLEDYVKPTKTMSIFVDGVAPLAKITQQRKRRYKTMYDIEKINEIKIKHNKKIDESSWTNICITPATKFMEKLNKHLIKHYKKKINNKIKYIYSSYHGKGEGEHKIFDHIRERIDKKDNIVIYGLDADLIFLSMISRYNIYLLREEIHLNNVKTGEMIYVSIYETKNALVNEIIYLLNDDKCFDDIFKKNINNLINDFVVLCFLLGNDFLPHLIAIDIYNDGLMILLNKYIQCIKYCYATLTYYDDEHNVKINMKFLKLLFDYLCSEEKYDIIIQKNYMKSMYKKCNIDDEYEKEKWNFENLIYNDPIGLSNKKNHNKYYKHFFDCKVNDVVDEYLKGIMWVTNYYFNNKIDWKYTYPFEYAPLIKDIFEWFIIDKNNINEYKFDEYNNINPLVQLITVIPKKCNKLLPKNIMKHIEKNKKLQNMIYPKCIELETAYKHMFWQCSPKLPKLQIELLEKEFDKIKLSSKSKKLNMINERNIIF